MTTDSASSDDLTQQTSESFEKYVFPEAATLFGCPEVVIPFRSAFAHGVVRSAKNRFWRSLTIWASGYLTDTHNRRYQKSECLAKRLAATARPVSVVDASFEPWLLRTAQAQPKAELAMRVEKTTTHKPMVYTVRPRQENELTEPMQKAKDRMEHRNPQFFLRNIGRHTMEPADELPLIRQSVESGLDESKLKELRDLIAAPIHPDVDTVNSVAFLRTTMDPIRFLLFKDPWHRYGGYELKTTINGPLWQYFPDEQAVARYGGKDATVLRTQDMSEES